MKASAGKDSPTENGGAGEETTAVNREGEVLLFLTIVK